MHKVLKNIALLLILGLVSAFVVSCDKEEETFDYQYDGLTSLPVPEMDLEQAKKIQRTGTVEEISLEQAVLEQEQSSMEEAIEPLDDDYYIEPSSPTDPNFM